MSQEQDQETRLIERAKAGDKKAIGELYRRHADAIYRFVYYRVKDTALAEDLTAEVFLKAMEGLADYEVTGAPFLSWLYYIARARTVDHWRRQQRWQKVALIHPLLDKTPRPEETVSRRDEWDAVLDALPELTDDQQQVILLRFIEEMELEEVAAALNKTVGAVKSLQHRALASLARLLKKETETGE